MNSRGFAPSTVGRTRRRFTLAWAVLFVLSILLQYAALTGSVLAGQVAPRGAVNAALAVPTCGIKPLDVELIIDTSGSMTSNSSGSPAHTRLYWAQQAAIQLVNDLANPANGGIGGATGHRVGVTTFSGTTSTSLGGWSSTAAQLATLINGIGAGGNTPLKTGMAQGASDLTTNARSNTGAPAANGAVRRVIIILSDGRPNPDQGPNGAVATSTSGQRPTQSQVDSFKASADEVWSIAIGQGGSGSSQVDLALMQLLAKPLAGHYFNVVDASNLGALFTDIFEALACPANLVVSKAVTEATAAPGATLHYAISVSNNGGTDATSVAVHDPIAALLAHGSWGSCDNSCTHDASSVDWTIPTVAAGGSVTVHFTIDLSTGGWNAGPTILVNTVIVANSNCAAQSADPACTKSTTVSASPHLAITKTATEQSFSQAGDVIHYTIVATNDGNTSLAAVTVSDPAVSNLDCTPANGSALAPGASLTCTASHTVSQADVDAGHYANTACVDAATATEACASKDIPGSQSPHLAITKTATEQSFSQAGDVIHYTIVATNDGNTSLAAVTVSDPAVSNLDCTPANGSALAPGASLTCTASHTVSQADVDAGHYANTACVDAATATEACASKDIPGSRGPNIGLVKTNDSGGALPPSGADVTYTYVVTNTGNVSLTNVELADDKCAVGTTHTGDDANPGVLDVGEAWTFQCTASITSTTTNHAQVSGHSGETTVTAKAQNTVAVGSGLALDKSYTGNTGGTASDGTGIAKVGDTLTYTLAYDLAGEPVTNVLLTDKLPVGLDYVDGSASSGDLAFVGYDAGSRTLSWGADGIQTGGSVTYQVTVAADAFKLAQPLTNVATMTTDELEPVQDSADVGVQNVQGATEAPHITLPPTDSLNGDQVPSDPGLGLVLTLIALIGIGLIVATLAPTRGRLRRERHRRP